LLKLPASVPRQTFFAALLLTLLIAGSFWELTAMQGVIITDDIFTSDIMNEAFPLRYALSEQLKAGIIPLWTPHIYGGFPILARAEAGIAYPLNLLLFGLLSPYVALNIVILLTLVIAAVSMYLFTREVGVNFPAAVMAGFAFALSGYMVSHMKHLSNSNAACWLPLGLFVIERGLRRNDAKYFIWLAVIFGLQHLSGHTQITYYSGVTFIVYFLARLTSFRRQSKQRGRWMEILGDRRVGFLVLALLMGSGIGAVQLLPTYELVSLGQRSGGVSFDFATNYAYDPKNLVMFLYPYANGDIGDGTYRGRSIFWEDYGYVGGVVLILSLYACIKNWKNPLVKSFAAFTVGSMLLVLGPNTPIYEAVFHIVPGMKYFRFPTRFLLITNVSLIVLASIGLTVIGERLRQKREKTAPRGNRTVSVDKKGKWEIGIVALAVIDLLYFQLRQNPIVGLEQWTSPPRTLATLQADSSLYRLYVVGGNESHKIAFARARGWQGDLQPYIDQRDFLQPSSNIVYGVSTADGYMNLAPNHVVEVWGDQNRGGLVFQTATVRENTFLPSPTFMKLMNMHNVKYVHSLWPVQGHDLIAHERIGEVYVYENPSAMPRMYLVHRWRLARDIEEGKRMLLSNSLEPAKEVILFDTPPLTEAGDHTGDVAVKQYRPDYVEAVVRSETDAILVFSDTYYPGWKAFVDAKETRIYQANITHRAIAVPAGVHDVRFVYDPVSVSNGFLITLTCVVVIAGLFGANIVVKRRGKGEVDA
jgi:hypothetical protein